MQGGSSPNLWALQLAQVLIDSAESSYLSSSSSTSSRALYLLEREQRSIIISLSLSFFLFWVFSASVRRYVNDSEVRETRAAAAAVSFFFCDGDGEMLVVPTYYAWDRRRVSDKVWSKDAHSLL